MCLRVGVLGVLGDLVHPISCFVWLICVPEPLNEVLGISQPSRMSLGEVGEKERDITSSFLLLVVMASNLLAMAST